MHKQAINMNTDHSNFHKRVDLNSFKKKKWKWKRACARLAFPALPSLITFHFHSLVVLGRLFQTIIK